MRPPFAWSRSSSVALLVAWLLVPLGCSNSANKVGLDGGLGGQAGQVATGTGGAGGTAVGTGGHGQGGDAVGSGGATSVGGAGGVGAVGGTGCGGAAGGLAGASGGAGTAGGKGGAGAAGGKGGAGAAGGKGGAGAAGAQGGASGAGGKVGSGGAGGAGAAAPECTSASDCKLWDGCCVCQAQPVASTPPADCAIACLQSQCSAEQLPADAVACTAGRCVAGFNCDASHVTCKIAVRACDPGYVPTVNAAGTCYENSCVPASQCATVTGCSACSSSEACVIYQTQLGIQTHCVSVPAACKNNSTCDCLGPTTCTGAFRSCANLSGQRGITCTCPNC